MPSYQQTMYCPKCQKTQSAHTRGKGKKAPELCKTCNDSLEKGSWSVTFDLPSGSPLRLQKRLSGYKSKDAAEMAYLAFKRDYVAPKAKKELPTGGDFESAFARFVMYQESRVKEGSYLDVQNAFRLHVTPFFKGVNVADIKPTDIVRWQADINAKTNDDGKPIDYSFKYKDKIFGYIKQFFNYCRDIESIISENPVKRQLRFIQTKIKEEMLIYTPEEYQKFRAEIKDLEIGTLFDTLYYTGMRKGELQALLWSDLKGDTISITKTYSPKTKKGAYVIQTPKSHHSVRDVLITKKLAAELEELKTKKNGKPNEYIFGGEEPVNEKVMDRARDKYHKAAEVKRIRIHDLRHSHVSYLISCNVDIVTIAKRIGDRVDTVIEHYAHIMPSKQHELIKHLEVI